MLAFKEKKTYFDFLSKVKLLFERLYFNPSSFLIKLILKAVQLPNGHVLVSKDLIMELLPLLNICLAVYFAFQLLRYFYNLLLECCSGGKLLIYWLLLIKLLASQNTQ